MTIARHYVMHALEGHEAALETALADVAQTIRDIPGNEGIELLRDLGNERRFIFIEKWDSVESHKGAADHMTQDALVHVMAAMDGPPEGAYLDYLKTL